LSAMEILGKLRKPGYRWRQKLSEETHSWCIVA
jgi:hypothetical protein